VPDRVRFLDLARLHESIRTDLDAAFDRVVRDSAFVAPRLVDEFEAAFAAAHGRAGAAGCGSGTDALALALRALGVEPGDEVIVPSMTFVATAEAVAHVGAVPVIADVDARTLLIDPVSVARVRTPRTRAVIPVHLYGHVVPFDHMEEWRQSGLLVVEDAAQAHLATWRGGTVGSVGQATCFSFYPGKNLGALGDGGAVVSDDDDVIEAVRMLRDHGRHSKYEHEVIGWCTRLDGIQAAFLAAKLPHLTAWTDARRNAAARYHSRLGDLLVPWEDGAVHHLLVARLPQGRRDEIQASLAASGIDTGIHYPVPLSRQPACAAWAKPCPASEEAGDRILSLPMDPLLTDADIDRVCDALEKML
jgi:dTDP-4-amino-4,6-dideoxygalactose transaminase